MKSLERYLGMINGKQVDFLPRVPILMQFAAEYIGSNYGAFAADYRVLTEANIRCAADFEIDQLSAISDPYRETQGFGAQIEFIKDGVPRCRTILLEDKHALASLPHPDPLHADRMFDRILALRFYHEHFAGQYSIMGWIEGPAAEAADLRGVSTFLVDLMEDQPFCADLMDRCVETGIDFARAQIAAGADTVGIGDAIASQVSPRIYNKLIQPREKRLVQAIQAMGALVRLHICGNITHLLPGIADLGVNILDVDYMVDMAAVRKLVGNRVVLAGNINPAAGVLQGTPDSIRETIRNTYAMVGNPYIVNAGCEIPSGTPEANLSALCEPVPYCP
jgi:MtaA/CmuA family methyltransferase